MCTAATYKTKDFYFGRTFDNECSYSEQVVITPRNYPFKFMHMGTVDSHYAMIGIAHVEQDYPLYYDAVNEKGLGMAGLNFPGYARYNPITPGKENIAVFELIQWLLCDCATVSECKEKIARMNLADIPFNDKLPVATLHWIIADSDGAVTLEATAQGMNVYDNPVGVMANNPTFPEHMFHLNNYMQLSAKPPQNKFAKGAALGCYCNGMGALGVPGELSSQSRFVRAAFVKMNSVSGESEDESVGQFFHILGAVEQQGGCCELESGEYERTLYTSCCNTVRGIYYYTTYGNRQITAVDMHREELDEARLVCYPLVNKEQIMLQNGR